MDNSSTKYIYDNIAKKVSVILASLDNETEDEDVASAQKNAKEILKILKDEINEEYSTLSKNAEWEQKYNDNDAMWRKKYMDRFNGKVEDIPEVKKSLEADRSENITINDLFTPKA